ncbi:MAG: tetratricopeptide repeat protein [Acidobacteriota bacterium]|nr:MAG: tetratricopeptide repeat protein [Acidobacteriota bacterium]
MMRHMILAFTALVLVSATPATAQTGKPEVVSPLGTRFHAQPEDKAATGLARQKLEADPRNIDLVIALGRTQATTWHYNDAIETYTRGIKIAPNDARLYRHRGHRYISIRQFAKAVRDLEKAAKLDGQDFDIWYHLGLAHYLRGDFPKAVEAYKRCYAVAEAAREKSPADAEGRDDSLIAISDWLYMTYRRMKDEAGAAKVLERITPGMKVKENTSYYDRLLMYKGLKSEADLVNVEKATDLEIATLGYGVGNWHLYNGDREKAETIFRKIVSGKYWPAFGFIAAEAELSRK